MKSMFYTGVGSRKVPTDVAEIMKRIASKLSAHGLILRSGGADGSDLAFESGCTGNKEIYYAKDATTRAIEIAGSFHPAWGRCSAFIRKLHGRNVFQVLGRDLSSPSRFLVCWTPDACTCHRNRIFDTGGTGTAISIASANNIPVYNLAHPDHRKRWIDWLNK